MEYLLTDLLPLDAGVDADRPEFSICTLVTSPTEYADMLGSFAAAGFTRDRCEYLYLDNSQGNRWDGYQAVNRFLLTARGERVIICHQDIRLHDDRVDALRGAIAAVEQRDPEWGVLGNAGGAAPGRLAIRITDPNGENTRRGSFPARVRGLDENFLIVRRAANLVVSRDIGGFHFYGTDICVIADMLGYASYAIDFHLHHLGGASKHRGKKKQVAQFVADYPRTKARFVAKYRRAWSGRWIQNTGALLYLSGSRVRNWLLNRNLVRSLVRRWYRWFHS